METVKQLIRYAARGFYDVRSVLIVDALLIHIVLSDEEMAQLLGIKSIKEVRALCLKLRDDRMLVVHSLKEEGTGQRQQTKTYYYIHNTETIDAIKWKVYTMKNLLEEQMGVESQPHGFVCDVCHSRYSSIDILDTFSPDQGGFICKLCGNVLREEDTSAEQYAGQEKLGKMMNQIQPIIEALKVIDESYIPENTFQSSLAIALPVPKVDEFGNIIGGVRDRDRFNLSKSGFGLATASNKSNIPQSTLQVKITSDQENADMEKKKKEEKARLAEENALPTWHLESTVGKSLYTGPDSGSSTVTASGVKAEPDAPEESQKVVDQSNEETLAAFYAQLAARQREEEAEEEEEDDDDDDDDDDDMEEVDVDGDMSVKAETATEVNNDDDDEDNEDEDEFEDVTT